MAKRRTGGFRRRGGLPAWAMLIVLALVAYQAWQSERGPLPEGVAQPVGQGPAVEQGMRARVQRVVDGDTLLLESGERIRLLGVDTPETKHPNKPVEPWGPEASEFTRRHVEGEWVRLEFDRERQDRYGRLLAYVYREEWLLNEALIEAGFSRAETKYPFSEAMKRRFRQAEAKARQNNAGIWSTASNPDRPGR